MTVDRAETLRYLRVGRVPPDAVLEARLAAVEKEVLAVVRPTAYWQLVPVEPPAPGSVRYRVGSLALSSAKLWAALRGCRHAFLFCATLGAGVDALLRTCGQRSAADLVMAQAVATALIEAYCDECQSKMLQDPAVRGESLRMRFSPGYGDLPLAVQRPLLAALDSVRRAGITLTEALLMLPSKSVSAIIGAGGENRESGSGNRG
ncbi:MAG: vitamin B12 dependent-methionine synthase activation domain-containing protein [Kiritimatiellia bacterium]